MTINFPSSPSTNDTYDYSGIRWTYNGTFWERNALRRRKKLTSDLVLYVRTDGNDSNTGFSNTSGAAFATIQKGWETLSSYDLNGHVGKVEIGQSGQTFTAGLSVTNVQPIGGIGILDLGGSTISTVSDCILTLYSNIEVMNGTLVSSTLSGIKTRGGITKIGSNMTFGSCYHYHLISYNQNVMIIENNYSITGGSSIHFRVRNNSKVYMNRCAVTLSGSLSFSIAFAHVTDGSLLSCYGSSFTGGTITGPRYVIDTGGKIITFGGGANFFPGNSAGTGGTTTGAGLIF